MSEQHPTPTTMRQHLQAIQVITEEDEQDDGQRRPESVGDPEETDA